MITINISAITVVVVALMLLVMAVIIKLILRIMERRLLVHNLLLLKFNEPQIQKIIRNPRMYNDPINIASKVTNKNYAEILENKKDILEMIRGTIKV